MKKIKKFAAILCALGIMAALTACGGADAPEKYKLAGTDVELDSFTAVVGSRAYDGVTELENQLSARYSGVTDAMSDLKAYSDYLSKQGFHEYFGMDNARMCMAKRTGDSAVLVSARTESEELTLNVEWRPVLELCFAETQYVSGSSLAILPNPELVIFNYPVLNEYVDSAETVNQLILDGVNQIIQYVKDNADGADFKLIGSYTLDSSLASNTVITLRGEVTINGQTSAIASAITISDVTTQPKAEYSLVAPI